MKRTLSLLIAIFGLTAAPVRAQEPADVRVLFIGNSFTYYHDLPRMIAELAKAGKQRTLVHDRETPGGCTLEKHWKDGKALAKIQMRAWDYVVLQDQSQAPLLKRDSMFEYGKKFDEEIKNRKSKTVLYLTWALQNQPEDQVAISKAYRDLAKMLNAEVAPVGDAWAAALQANPKRILHEADRKHPNATGTYLAACVFYATFYARSPEGLPGSIGRMTDEEARPLQALAWKIVQNRTR